jgi:hypothetical protein
VTELASSLYENWFLKITEHRLAHRLKMFNNKENLSHYAMQALRGRVIIAPTHFCLGTILGEWSASRPGSAFSPVMETRAGLDTQAKEKNPLPQPGIESRSSSMYSNTQY